MATTDLNEEILTTHRSAMLEELGFSKKEALMLSEAYYDTTIPARSKNDIPRTYRIRVDHHYVRRLIAAGATHRQVLDILL